MFGTGSNETLKIAKLARELQELEKRRDFLVGERVNAEAEARGAHEAQKRLHLEAADGNKLVKANERVATAQRNASGFGPAIDEMDVAISQKRAELEAAEERVAALQRADQIDAGLATLAATDEAVISALKARIAAYEAFGTGGAAEGAKGRLQQMLNEVISEGRAVAAIYRPVAERLRSGDVKITRSASVQQQPAPMPEMVHGTASVPLPSGVGYRVPVFSAGA